MRYQVSNSAGEPIDAHFEVEGSEIVFHSRGGTKGSKNARNTDYREGLLNEDYHATKIQRWACTSVAWKCRTLP